MLDLQPTAIFADGPEGDGKQFYRVTFIDKAGKEVEHVFTVENIDGMDGLNYTNDYWKATCTDPLEHKLTRAILYFHEARKPVLVEPE